MGIWNQEYENPAKNSLKWSVTLSVSVLSLNGIVQVLNVSYATIDIDIC